MGKKKINIPVKNPFNLKVNRQKHTVLGQKLSGQKGNPIISHGLARDRRKAILDKKKWQKKANKFSDHRLVDGSSSKEDSGTIRLVRQRQKRFKKNLFNLNDSESLTHMGKSLDNIQDFEGYASGSDDDQPLDAKFVSQAHFGGFPSEELPTTQKEFVAQLILDSKQRKEEKKIERELNIDLTEKLDAQWKELHAIFHGSKMQDPQETNDPYDIAVQELKFESKVVPAKKLESPEEIARKQNEKLKILESERLHRMVDNQDIKGADDHISADSIYDGIQLEEIHSDDAKQISDDSDSDSQFNEMNNASKEENTVESIDLPLLDNDSSYLVKDNCPEDAIRIAESIMNSNHVAKWGKNRKNIDNVFGILLSQLFSKCDKPVENIEDMTLLFQHLYTLAELSPVETAVQVLEILDKEQEQFQISKECGRRKNILKFEILLLLKLCSILYSSSDFRHPVITPASLFMSDILSSKLNNSSHNLISRLFVSGLYLEWISHSKRIVPEAISFLNYVLCNVLKQKPKSNIKQNSFQINLLLLADVKVINVENTDILSVAVKQLCGYVELYSQVPSFSEIFQETRTLCASLSEHYSSIMLKLTEKLNVKDSLVKSYLTFPRTKPKPLKLFEPYFDSKFTNKREDDARKRKLAKRVSQKIRKEEKSLLREIRRDTKMLASEKLKQQIESDNQRKNKVKQLYQELASQEGEYKKMMKKKA